MTQQIRWKKGWFVNSLFCSKFIWKTDPFIASVYFYPLILVTLLTPFMAVRAFVYTPIFRGLDSIPFYIVGVMLVAALIAVYYRFVAPQNKYWPYLFVWPGLIWLCSPFSSSTRWPQSKIANGEHVNRKEIMYDKHIKRSKYLFGLGAVIILAVMVSSSFYLRHNPYTTAGYLSSQIAYFKNRLQFASMRGLALSSASVYQSSGNPAVAVPVLVYHDITEGKVLNPDTDITLATFKDQMFALKRAGYQTINAHELYRFLRGEISLPERPLVITFDDGIAQSVVNGTPILKALDYEAVMFVITSRSIDERSSYYVNQEQIAQMERGNVWDVQAHTHDGHAEYDLLKEDRKGHFFGDKVWLASENRLESNDEFNNRVFMDLSITKRKLGAIIGEENVIATAYPFGDYGQNFTNYPAARVLVPDLTSRLFNLAFYQYAPSEHFSQNYYSADKKGDQFFMVRRMIVDSGWGGDELVQILENGAPKNLPFTSLGQSADWVETWSEVALTESGLWLNAPPDQTGAATILDGSGHWQDYVLTSTVNVPKQNNINIWVRYQNDKNNAACNFGRGFAHVEQVIDGDKRVIKGARAEGLSLPAGDFEIGVRVAGRTIECSINGVVLVTSTFLDPLLTTGGIGFKTWDAQPGITSLLIKSLHIESITPSETDTNPPPPSTVTPTLTQNS